jgi:hypothetical protein
MQRRQSERFRELCEHAEVEDDPAKLADLAEEICDLLELEMTRLKKHPNEPAQPHAS